MTDNKRVKPRACKSCGQTFLTTSVEIQRHARLCREGTDIAQRMKALGLVQPEPMKVPALTIRKGWSEE